MDLKKLEKIFKIKISDENLFQTALTHPSLENVPNYQRLEFLGDAVLKLCTSEILYKMFPDYPEGNMSKIRSVVISDKTLADIALKSGLDGLIITGAEVKTVYSICACAFEAVLGAYYSDGKFEEIKVYLKKVLTPYIKEADAHFEEYNAKGVLQEYTQSLDTKTPIYEVIEEKGPSHKRVFLMQVCYNDKILAQAEGKTKKEAEQNCAYKACKVLGVIK